MRKLEASDEENLKNWFDIERQRDLVDFKVDINKQALAKTFGGRVFWDYDGQLPVERIAWPEGTDLDAINRHIQREMHRFIQAANDPTKSRLIKNDKDDFGNMIDDAHPDYREESARLEHVNLMRKSFPNGEMLSTYEFEFVGRDIIPPIHGLNYTERFNKQYLALKKQYNELSEKYHSALRSPQIDLGIRVGNLALALTRIERLSHVTS